MLSSIRSTTLLLLLLTLASTVLSQNPTTTVTQVPTPDPSDPAAPPPVDPNDTSGWSVIIIDKQWTQLFIGLVPLLLGIMLLSSIYAFIWVPWWENKMKAVEKEWNRLEKERLGR